MILSACNPGTPGAGAGLSDLASAFLYAGAGSLLLTHWEIDSGAGVEIMKRVATRQSSGEANSFPPAIQLALGRSSLGVFPPPAFLGKPCYFGMRGALDRGILHGFRERQRA